LQNISISNKCCSFELSINESVLKKSIFFPQKNIKILSCTTLFNV